LVRILSGLDIAALGHCGESCRQWSVAAHDDVPWRVQLRHIGQTPYATVVTEAGVNAWLSRELGGEILGSRKHLQKLQQSRKVRELFRFLHEFHNGVEIELQTGCQLAQAWYATPSVIMRVTMELLNFWPHSSWVLIKPVPVVVGDEEPEEPEVSARAEPLGTNLKLTGSARIRCWDSAQLPSGRFGQGYCYLLECGSQGEVFRLPPLTSLEIGRHKISGPVQGGVLSVEVAMGRWPSETDCPLQECSANAFLHDSTGDTAIFDADDDESGVLRDIGEEWLAGRPLPEPFDLGPVLYRSVIQLPASAFLRA
jgi:hypothetical protein